MLQEFKRSVRFQFGENWRSFVKTVSQASILEAERALARLLPVEAIRGRTFLDIGCGSGLSMLAALRLGAESVNGIDFDASSVEAARALLKAYAPEGRWVVSERSVFALSPDTDGVFDNVYSWGVLHHTGDVWRALECASAMVAPHGNFAVALYRKTMFCSLWAHEKRFYTSASAPMQATIRWLYVTAYRIALLAQCRWPSSYERDYRSARGMEWNHDVHDWLGGYPYESVLADDVKSAMHRLGFDVERVFEHPVAAAGLFGTHCDEFVAVRHSSRRPGSATT
jgi:predicted RNA methylase